MAGNFFIRFRFSLNFRETGMTRQNLGTEVETLTLSSHYKGDSFVSS
jgi:hypothetical protein